MSKNRITIIVLLMALTISCGENKREKEVDVQVKALTESNEALKQELNNRDSIMNDALYTISDISATLSMIKAREGVVISEVETGKVEKDKIKEDLEFISKVLDSKRSTVASLNRSIAALKEANIKVEGLTLLVSQLEEQLEKSNETITSLLQNIDNLHKQIEIIESDRNELIDNNAQLEMLLASQTAEMNRAYYIVGSESELIEKEIISKKGVIGRTLVVNPNLDKSRLVEIDITKLDKIEIKASKAEVIGEFPENSYTLITGERKKDIESLYIDNKEAFWRDSKILIICYKR